MPARSFSPAQVLVSVLLIASPLFAQEAKVVEKEGKVVVTKAGRRAEPAQVGVSLVARDKLGTGESSRAVLKMSPKWFARVDEQTDVEITPGAFTAKDKDALKIALGGAFIYSREEEGELKVQTPSATGGLRGTQLVVRVYPGGKTHMQVLEGEVDLGNEFGSVLLRRGEAGEAEPGKAPRKTAVIEARNLLQWALYYPAVLQPDELGLAANERGALGESLEAYRQGDLLRALDAYPQGYRAASNAAKLYQAAVLLATGQVDRTRQAIDAVPAENPGRRAIERMVAAVQTVEQPGATGSATASEALAESYYQQSRRELDAARAAAKRATELAPDSGFAWVRLAELEFSFGRIREASAALARGLKLAPRHAQAHALRGYLLCAENRIGEARAAFEEAIRLDGGLGNAWLGLGLTKIRQGSEAEGRSDLQTAAVVEPTRSFFYSYHGKALSAEGSDRLAHKDLELAKQLDAQDPTPWLYSAIQAQQEGRYNRAIDELQESQRLNDNRRVYRSQFLLDQDSAVRSTNLARIYQNNGMADLAVREATRAVETDYTNASAHQFLANSFDALRDPTRTSLRHETAWFNEQLLSSLLAPVGGGPLSQFVSQQEYSKLLAADGIGGNIVTEWREDGYIDHQTSLFATRGKWSGGIDFAYNRDHGTRPNSDDLRKEAYGQFKYQVSADDIAYTLGKWQRQRGGDLRQSYANTPGNGGLRFEDNQEPGLLLAGWNHRWAPGAHTLLLAGRLAAKQSLTAPATTQVLILRDAPGLAGAALPAVGTNPDGSLRFSPEFERVIQPFLTQGVVTGASTERFDFATRREIEIYTGELQHIWQAGRNTLLLGGRWQRGELETHARLDLLGAANRPYFASPAALQQVAPDFERENLYAYDFFQVTRWATVFGGVAWDRIERPANFRNPPVSDRPVATRRTSGKAGFTVSPSPMFTLRGVYSESVGGVTFDESVRLEPVQLAGFEQAFRSVIPEALAGSVEAPIYKNAGLSLEGRLASRTWWSASFNSLRENVDRTLGDFVVLTAPVFPRGTGILPSSREESLRYRESILALGVNQLIGDAFAVGANYRRTRARLSDIPAKVPSTVVVFLDTRDEATLDEVNLQANWNSPSGGFARAEANWYGQTMNTATNGVRRASPPGDRFWQGHVLAGYRFHHNRREISAGLLNLGDRDYRLNPLTTTRELPRARTFFVRCRLGF